MNRFEKELMDMPADDIEIAKLIIKEKYFVIGYALYGVECLPCPDCIYVANFRKRKCVYIERHVNEDFFKQLQKLIIKKDRAYKLRFFNPIFCIQYFYAVIKWRLK